MNNASPREETENEVRIFKKNCLDILQNSKEQVSKLGQIELYRIMHDIVKPQAIDEDEGYAKDVIEDSIEALRLRIQYHLEKHGLKLLLEQFNQDFGKITKGRGELSFEPYFDYFHSPYLDLLERYLKAITCDVAIDNENEYRENSSRLQLERFLQGTGKLLKDKGIMPENEADVKKEVFHTLIHFYPDTVREIPIARISKTYKPDMGIKSLKTAIEYKFATSEQEAKTIIGGIFEDVLGYEGSDDWKYFYAVLYMNDNYMTSSQIEAEFDASKILRSRWKPILIIGKGERTKKNGDG
jgi:uncharacterized protein YaiE (UPF0345 family)